MSVYSNNPAAPKSQGLDDEVGSASLPLYVASLIVTVCGLMAVTLVLEDSGYFVKPGTRRDVYLTASGRVLLAFQSAADRAAMVASASARTGELMSTADLARRLDVIRLQGFEEMPSLQIAGIHNFSFPVLDVTGKAVAAMTMPFLVRTDIHSNLDDARNILRDAALELSRHLGYVPDDPGA